MYYWTPSGSRKGPINRVCPSFRPSFHLSGCFLGIVLLIFSKFWHGARIPCEVVRDRVGFFGKKCFVPKIGKMGQKQVFFQFIGKFGHQFSLNLIYNENLYYLLCPCTNPISVKILFLRYGPKCSQPIRLQDFLINHISTKS